MRVFVVAFLACGSIMVRRIHNLAPTQHRRPRIETDVDGLLKVGTVAISLRRRLPARVGVQPSRKDAVRNSMFLVAARATRTARISSTNARTSLRGQVENHPVLLPRPRVTVVTTGPDALAQPVHKARRAPGRAPVVLTVRGNPMVRVAPATAPKVPAARVVHRVRVARKGLAGRAKVKAKEGDVSANKDAPPLAHGLRLLAPNLRGRNLHAACMHVMNGLRTVRAAGELSASSLTKHQPCHRLATRRSLRALRRAGRRRERSDLSLELSPC